MIVTAIPLVDLKAQYQIVKPAVDVAIDRVVTNANFILGEEVARFEREFAGFVGAAGAVGVASGTAALHLALRACGVGPGDEVITTSLTFVATAEAISQTGARPVFVDIDPRTYTLDPGLVDAAITPNTRAIVPVHLYGQPAAMDDLSEVARRHDLSLIEDAAQAHGAEYSGRKCGTLGDLACFSFYPGKNLGAYGDAGAVTGTSQELLGRVRKLRDHGRTTKYEHDEVGFNERMDALQAAVLQAKLPNLSQWNDARRAHAQRYMRLLSPLDVEVPYEAPDRRHVYHLYVIRTPRRDALQAHLKSRGVDAGVHYPIPVHCQRAYVRLGYGDVHLPVTERISKEVLSLPMYPELRADQIDYVVGMIEEFFKCVV